MKVVNSSHLSSFGGINFVVEEFDRIGIGSFLNTYLPELPSQSSYSWKDIMYSFWSVLLCGGDCAEDLGQNFKKSFTNNPFFKIPSPDRVLNRFKELACESIEYETERGQFTNLFNHNDLLNILGIKILKKTSTFKNKANVLDYDNTVIFTNKKDSKTTYKLDKGYVPGVGMIGKHVVYVENRNGNSSPLTLQHETLQRMFDLLKSENIEIEKFRADSASYQLRTIDVLFKNVKKFYVRTNNSTSLQKAIASINNWKEVVDGNDEVLIGDILFTPFESSAKKQNRKELLREYRLVVKKVKRADGQLNILTREAYDYSAILTSDMEFSNQEVIDFYNDRGNSEIEFDVLKNDFGWKSLPFSSLAENSVYLTITAICRNLFEHIINVFSVRFKGLSNNFRLKKFIYRFLCVPAKWIYQARNWKLKIFGTIEYRSC